VRAEFVESSRTRWSPPEIGWAPCVFMGGLMIFPLFRFQNNLCSPPRFPTLIRVHRREAEFREKWLSCTDLYLCCRPLRHGDDGDRTCPQPYWHVDTWDLENGEPPPLNHEYSEGHFASNSPGPFLQPKKGSPKLHSDDHLFKFTTDLAPLFKRNSHRI